MLRRIAVPGEIRDRIESRTDSGMVGRRFSRAANASGVDVGGWGLRIVPGRATAVMTRKGECLILRRVGKREAIISADDAETAAAVLNTLVRRTRAAR